MHLTDWMERVDLEKEIQEVYLHSFLFKLAVKLVAIFLPLYILELGFSFQHVFLFFAVYYGAYIFASLPNAGIVSRIGYKHASLAASPVILLFYVLLRQLSTSNLQLFLVALTGGIGFNLYWSGMNPEVATSSHSDDREKETGYFFSMPALASIFSPFVGGMILAVSGFEILFLFTLLLVAASFLPFLFSREHHDGMDIDILEFAGEMETVDFSTFVAKGINSMGKKVLWPLYLAVIIQNSMSIGGAGSFLALGGAVTSIFIGKVTNDGNRTKVIAVGALFASVSYLLMSQVTTPGAAMLVSAMNGLSYTSVSLPIYSKAMDHAEKEDVIEYFAFREIALAIGRIATLGALMLAFFLLPQAAAFTAGFFLLAAAIVIIGFLGSRME
ncbi:MAG: MFS transporter [Candidatus Nanohaloarchaea archaeon]